MRSATLRLVAMAGSLVLAASPAVAQVQPQAGSDELVVNGVRTKWSDWRMAETDHIVLLGEGREAELVRIARNLERLHWLLSGLLDRTGKTGDTTKIRITLIGDTTQFESMGLYNWRWQQGPFNAFFRESRYVDPRESGVVLAAPDAPQRIVIEHSALNAHTLQAALGGMQLGQAGASQSGDFQSAIGANLPTSSTRGRQDLQPTYGEKAIETSAESQLYAGYAQHYLQTYFPAAYPRWYLDGFGQIFATLAVKGDNVLEFGRAPDGARAVLTEIGGFPIQQVLDDSYLTLKPSKTHWTPVHAWMLTHFLLFSDTRRPQLRQYLALRAAGADPAKAAAVFGDLNAMMRDLRAYYSARKPVERITFDGSVIDQPMVNRLREADAAFVKGRLELGARLTLPAEAPPNATPDQQRDAERVRIAAVQRREEWLQRLRREAGRWPGEIGPQLLLAEAECRSGNADACLAAASRAAALEPGNASALSWKGRALTLQALAAAPADRARLLASARASIIQANRADPESGGPLLAYYASYADAGEAAPVAAVDGVQKALMNVPSSPTIRVSLASALVAKRRDEAARLIILPVAVGPYDTPEQAAARAILARTLVPEAARSASSPTNAVARAN